MKKLFSLFALCAVALVACNPEDEPFTPDPEFKLTSEANVLFDADGGDGKITFTLHYAAEGQGVTAEADVDWITNVAVSDKVVNYIVKANDSEDVREGKITLKHDIYTLNVNVKQQGKAGNEPGPGPEPGDKYDVEYIANYINGGYYGGEAGSYNYFFSMSKNGQPGDGYVNYDSDYYFFDAYSDIAVGTGSLVLAQGVYEFDANNTGAAGTFGAEYSYYISIDAQGNQDMKAITGGTLTVTNDKIEAVITLEDNTVHHVVYTGSLELGYPQEVISNLTEDYEINIQTGYAVGECYGDYYGVGSNNWMIYLYADAEDPFNGEFILLELLGGSTTSYAGTYTALTDASTAYEGTFLPGEFDGEDLYYSWLTTMTEGEVGSGVLAPMVEGEIIVADDVDKDGNPIVTVQFDCYDDAGNNIFGVFKGISEVYYEEETYMASANQKHAKRKALFNADASKSVKVIR